MNTVLKTIVIASLFVLAGGCANTKNLEASITSLTNQVGTLQSDVDSLKRSTSAATQSATEAQRAAQAASGKADQAIAVAQAADHKADGIDEKLGRMYAKAVSK